MGRASAGARMNRQDRHRAEPVLKSGEDRRQGVRAMDHDEASAGLEDREATPNQARSGARRLAGKDMRPRPRPVGRSANRAGVEERRVGDDRADAPSVQPRLAPGARVADVEGQELRVRPANPLRSALSPARAARPASTSTRSALARSLRLRIASPTAPTPAPTSAKRPCRKSAAAASRAASVPARCPRLGWTRVRRPPSQALLDNASGCDSSSSPFADFSHCAVRRRGPPRSEAVGPSPPRGHRPESASAGTRASPRPRPCAGRRRRNRRRPPSGAIRSR